MKTVYTVLDLLETFLNSHEVELSVSRMAELSGLNTSTTSRVASSLVKRGYLRQSKKRGKYSLGTKFLNYSDIIRGTSMIRELSLPFLIRFSKEINEYIILTVPDGFKGRHLANISAKHVLNIFIEEGATVDLYSTGVGKVILAHYTEKQFAEYKKNIVLKKKTPETITRYDVLKKQLSMIRKKGIAIDDEENVVGVKNIAAPIKNAKNIVICALGVVGPTSRLTSSKLNEIATPLKKYALEISKCLGYQSET